MKRLLILENGATFIGDGFGSSETKIAEIVFNTSMVGYQEILSDPSYMGQMVVMSYPLIGNYGLADDDYESKGVYLSGFIVREYNDQPSNFRFTKTVNEVANEYNVAGISGIDTRELVRIIRNEGTMKAMITDAEVNVDEALQTLKNTQLPNDAVRNVSTKKIWYSRTRNPLFTVVAVDCGIKLNTVRKLNQHGCNVVIVPYNTSYRDILKLNPDGILISNGPGNPENVSEVIGLIRSLIGKMPIFGICLGHQLIALAYGAKTYKMKYGHRGANHPVKNLLTGKIEITSQNHSYEVDIKSLNDTPLKLTHINTIDGGAEGLFDEKNSVISLQYHPESHAGPEDSEYLFDQFVNLMIKKGEKGNAKENRY